MPVKSNKFNYNEVIKIFSQIQMTRVELALYLNVTPAYLYNWISSLNNEQKRKLKTCFKKRYKFNYESYNNTMKEKHG